MFSLRNDGEGVSGLADQRGPPGVGMSVWNPVMGGEVRLSPLPVSGFSRCAARLYVDRQTNSFRVLFVTTVMSDRGDKISAHVFDSVAVSPGHC